MGKKNVYKTCRHKPCNNAQRYYAITGRMMVKHYGRNEWCYGQGIMLSRPIFIINQTNCTFANNNYAGKTDRHYVITLAVT